jgi:hypothetical protein
LNRFLCVSVALIALVLTSGCTSASGFVDIEKDWKNDEWKGEKPKKVLVIALVPDAGTREDLEDQFVVYMRQHDIRAFASRNFIPTFKDVSADSVKEVMAREGIQAVITMRAVDVGAGQHSYFSDWYSHSSMWYYDSFYNYWNEASIGVFTPTDAPKGTTDYLTVKVETNMYSIDSGGTLVYSGLTSAVTSRRMGETMTGYAEKLTKRLQRYNLL